MLSFLRRLFGSKSSTPQIAEPITAHSIYSYIANLEKDRDRLHDETWNRGLSFGDLRLTSVFGNGLEFDLYHEDSRDVSLNQVRSILEDLISKRKLTWLSVHEDEDWQGKLIVEVDITAPDTVEGAWWSGVRGPEHEPFQQRVFLTAEKLGVFKFSANGIQGLAMIFQVAQALGFSTAPARFAKESPLSLNEVVVYAYHWQDKNTGKYYTEVKYKALEEKSANWIGANQAETFTEANCNGGYYKVVVLGGIKKPAQLQLNNRMVKSRKIKEATVGMLKAQQRIRDRLTKHYVCSIKECGHVAAYEIHTTHFEMSDFGGTSSMGGISYSCDNFDHKQALEERSGGIRVTSHPIRELETW